jgi:hypothetical protein
MKIATLLICLAAGFGLGGCASQTVEGPTLPPAVSGPSPTPRPTPRPTPAVQASTPRPTPDPLAPAPLPQKPVIPGVSPLSHGADQPLYRRQD